MAALAALAAVGGFLVLVVGVAALTPIHFRMGARGGASGALACDGEVTWGWGLARIHVCGEPRLLLLGRAVRWPRSAARARGRRRGRPPARLLQALPRFIAALHIRLRGDLRVGFMDPALTGMVAAAAASGCVAHGVVLTADFVDPGFHGDLALRGWCLPGALALIAISALWRAGRNGRPLQSAPRGWLT